MCTGIARDGKNAKKWRQPTKTKVGIRVCFLLCRAEGGNQNTLSSPACCFPISAPFHDGASTDGDDDNDDDDVVQREGIEPPATITPAIAAAAFARHPPPSVRPPTGKYTSCCCSPPPSLVLAAAAAALCLVAAALLDEDGLHHAGLHLRVPVRGSEGEKSRLMSSPKKTH